LKGGILHQARVFLPILAAVLLAAAQARAQQVTDRYAPEAVGGGSAKALVVAKHWMVAAADPQAAAAGAAILKAGGNAVDAAVAVQFVLGLVEPQSSGLGGGAFLLDWDAARHRLTTYDGRETAPLAATPALFLDATGQPLRFMQAVVGGRSVGTPGVPRLLATVHAAHGRLPWARLFRPAIRLATHGFRVSARLSGEIAEERATLMRDPTARAYFFDAAGAPLKPGSLKRNPAYAETLRKLAAQGPAGFYRGRIAADIVRKVRHAPGNPGVLAPADFATYAAKERPPVCVPYRAFRVCGMGPPSSGGLTVGEILGTLEPYDLARLGPASPAAWRLIADASRLAFADRERYIADEDFVPVPAQGLIDPAYLRTRAALLKGDRALAGVKPGEPHWSHARREGDGHAIELPSTSHFSIVDRDGNVVAVTSSIESAFGARRMTHGFMLTTELTDCSCATHDAEGRPIANAVAPGKRPRSSMAPTIVFRDGRPVLAIGTPGGSAIIGLVVKALVGWIDWGLNVQQAIDLPNVLDRFGPVEIERGTAAEKLAAPRRALGFAVRPEAIPPGFKGIAIFPGRPEGGADPRRAGIALGG
jgi:gamma-glutamyltranspeptidase/glutathione hydrolase